MGREETRQKLIEFGVDPNHLDDELGWDLSTDFLYNLDLSGMDLSNLSLEKANLEGVNLNRVNFLGSNLKGAFLTGSDVFYADVMASNLTGVEIAVYQLVQMRNLEYAILDPGRYADAVAAGYKPEKK